MAVSMVGYIFIFLNCILCYLVFHRSKFSWGPLQDLTFILLRFHNIFMAHVIRTILWFVFKLLFVNLLVYHQNVRNLWV